MMSGRQAEDEADRQWLRLPEHERKRRKAESLRRAANAAEGELTPGYRISYSTAAAEGLTVISEPTPSDSELMPKTPASDYRMGTVVEDRHGIRWEVTTGGQRDEYMTWKRLGRAPDDGAGGRPSYTL